jgi:hypothetical protein
MRYLNLVKALGDASRYLDLIPMNHTEFGSHHNDEEPWHVEPDFYDIMVRGEVLSEDSLYCEIEYIEPEHVENVEQMLIEIYDLNGSVFVLNS